MTEQRQGIRRQAVMSWLYDKCNQLPFSQSNFETFVPLNIKWEELFAFLFQRWHEGYTTCQSKGRILVSSALGSYHNKSENACHIIFSSAFSHWFLLSCTSSLTRWGLKLHVNQIKLQEEKVSKQYPSLSIVNNMQWFMLSNWLGVQMLDQTLFWVFGGRRLKEINI